MKMNKKHLKLRFALQPFQMCISNFNALFNNHDDDGVDDDDGYDHALNLGRFHFLHTEAEGEGYNTPTSPLRP